MEWKGDDWRVSKGAFLATGSFQFFWFCLFFAIPFAFLLYFSFAEKRDIIDLVFTGTLQNYARAFDQVYLVIFVKSLLIAGGATVVCLLIGFPVALGIAFAPERLKPILLLVVMMPFWINVVIRTYSLIAVFRTNGFLNDGLEILWTAADFTLELLGSAEGLGEEFEPRTILYSDVGVILGVVYTFIPFMILPIFASLDRFDRSYLEASLDLGASQWRTFRSVLLPLALPGVLSGIIIVFVPALGAFYIPNMLGGPDSILIGNVIEQQFKGTNDWAFGSALSLILMAITFALVSLRARFKVPGTTGG